MLLSLATLLFAVPQRDSAPVLPIHQYTHTTWTKSNGAPQGIRAMAQTGDRYIWLGTFTGLFRFDGVRFVKFAPLTGDTLPTGVINRLVTGRDGALWVVGTGGRVFHISGQHSVSHGRPEDSLRVILVAESKAGELIAASVGGLFRLSGGKWENVGPAWGYPGKQCYAVWYDRDETLWAVTEDRVVYLPAGASKFVDAGHRVASISYGAHFAQERDGTIWMSELNKDAHTLHKDGGDSSRAYTVIQDDPLAVLIDHQGSLWLASAGHGLRRVPRVAAIRGRTIEQDGPELEQFAMKDGAINDVLPALLEDHEGNIWVGSSAGLERYRVGTFTPVLTLSPGRSRYVIAGRDSSVWTSSVNEGTLERFGPGSYDSLFPGTNSTGIAQDSAGGTYLLEGSHILKLGGNKKWTRIPLRRGSGRRLFSETVDRAGKLWSYSQEMGLLRLEGDTLIQVSPLENQSEPAGMLFSDKQGRVWFGQRNRVVMVDGEKITQYGIQEGIAGGFFGFFEDRSGAIWVSTGGGLGRMEGDRFRVLDAKQGITGSSVFGAAQDDDGGWWVNGMEGVFRFPAGELERALTDSTYVATSRIFDEADGMPGAPVKATYSPMLAKSGDGKIWIAADSGLAYVDPNRLPPLSAPPVSIEVMRLKGREYAVSDSAEIPPGYSDLEIDYTSLTFRTPERVRFRYQLEGVDTTWRDVGDRRRAYYSGLGPGSYRFRVTASYGDGLWNEAGAAWSFRVLPAWYQTIWFRILAVLAIAGIGGTMVALVQRGRHNRAQRVMRDRYEATLAERARIAQDLHDTLLQGFAGVTLQLKAVELAMPKQPEAAAATDSLLRVQQLARESMREARERVWDLHETSLGNDDLPAALERMALERTDGTDTDVSVTSSGERRRLSQTLEDAAYRSGREAVVNAVRHADARRIEIRVAFSEKLLRLEVQDDGRGFTAEEGEEARRQGHFGLTGMRDRATRVGGKCEVSSQPGNGTVVTLELPL